MNGAQTPPHEPAKKYWWAAGILVPIIVACIGLIGQWHKQDTNPAVTPPAVTNAPESGVPAFLWLLPIVILGVGAGVVSPVAVGLDDDLPTPVLILFAFFGAGFAIWAAIVTNSDPPKKALPVMIFLALCGILMLGYGIACHFRDLHLGTYFGCCAAAVAFILLIMWEIGPNGGWVDEVGTITDSPGVPHIWFAVFVAVGVLISGRNALAWISLAVTALSLVATVLLDFNDSDGSELSPLGLGAFLAAIVMVYIALRGEDADELPGWVIRCLLFLRRGGGMVLIAMAILGFATNRTNGGFNGAAILTGVIASVIGFTNVGLSWRWRH